jgi:hypothetical protein
MQPEGGCVMKNVGYEAELLRQYFDRATSFDAFAGGPVPTSSRHVRVVLFRRTTLRLAGRSVACESLHLKNTYLASAAIPRIRSKITKAGSARFDALPTVYDP